MNDNKSRLVKMMNMFIQNYEYIRQHDKLTVVIWEMRLTNLRIFFHFDDVHCTCKQDRQTFLPIVFAH
jgi:hypothetical protein